MSPSYTWLQARSYCPGHSEQVFSQAINLKINQAASQFHVALPHVMLFLEDSCIWARTSLCIFEIRQGPFHLGWNLDVTPFLCNLLAYQTTSPDFMDSPNVDCLYSRVCFSAILLSTTKAISYANWSFFCNFCAYSPVVYFSQEERTSLHQQACSAHVHTSLSLE